MAHKIKNQIVMNADLYPTLSPIADDERVRIRRDGVELAVVASPNIAFVWIANHTHGSVSNALLHEGYTCEVVND